MERASNDIVMISALEHYSYCARQCALIHVEATFNENAYTLRGRHAHARVDAEGAAASSGIRIERAVPLWSDRLGLVGKADVVELHGETPYPVEYKVGRRRRWTHETLQVCAQALCLEEMIGRPVPRGAIYYRTSRRRREVEFDDRLREEVENAVRLIRGIRTAARLPAPVNDQRCERCSLIDVCMPEVVANRHRLRTLSTGLFHVDDA